ncbi:MAG: hypothetical protein ABI670_08575 [Chloroflexota bacterium]
MSRAISSIKLSFRTVVAGLAEPRFYAALLLGLLIWVIAYQNKRDYSIKIADLAYHPYISGFNDPETPPTEPAVSYRWSKGSPQIFLPGIGNQPVELSITTRGARPGGSPPELTLNVRGQTFKLQTQAGEHTDTFFIDRGNSWEGDFRLDISVPTFTPPNDPRELGVIIKDVTVKPADYGLRPVVIPPVGTLLLLLSGLIGGYLFGLITTRRRSIGLLLVLALVGVTAAEIVAVRPELGFHAGQLPTLWAWGLVLALAGRALLDAVLRPAGRWFGFVAAAGSAAFALAFMVRFGGLTYAQFLTSDIFLHIHNVTYSVLNGVLVFTEPVPDGTQVPYPPAYYMIIAVLTWFTGSSDDTVGMLLKWTSSLLDASACIALAWSGWRLRPGPLGGLAALAYLCSPAAFDLFSAGNYTNLFGQSVLNITLLGGLVFLSRRTPQSPTVPFAFLLVGFGLTMLGHYGMMLGTLAILGFFSAWTVAATVRKSRTKEAWWLLGAGGLALVGSFALYYRNLLDEIWNQWSGLFGRLTGGSGVQTGDQPARPGFVQSLQKLPGKLFGLVGPLMLVLGAVGAAHFRMRAQAGALLGSWLLAAGLFALLDQVVGDSVRWYYLAAVPVTLLAARILSLLLARGLWARRLILLSLATMSYYMLALWIDLIFTRYH